MSEYGEYRYYPGPGQRLFSDLAGLPGKRTAIASGNEALFACKRQGDWKEAIKELEKGNRDAMA